MTEQKAENALRKRCFQVVEQVLGGCAQDFDGYLCWPSTKPGTLTSQNCSNDFVKSETKGGVATRQCTINGTWFTNGYPHAWTNFSQCGYKMHYYSHLVEQSTLEPQLEEGGLKLYCKFKDYLNAITLLGYSLSIISLLIAIAIFIGLKRLHCERNKLHVNLFLSYLIKGVIYVTKIKFLSNEFFNGYVSYNEDGTQQISYTWLCKLFLTLNWYFVLANFTFLLMEGLYLRNLIFLNLFSESHGTGIYCIVGWVTPMFFITVWVILKILLDDNYCWNKIEEIPLNYLIDVPIIITVLANFVLFVIIMRVLIMKIHFTSTFLRNKRTKYRQLIRSTLILIPLYGIPYVLSTILRFLYATLFPDKHMLDVVYIFFDQITSSFQGLFAALVYCLLNSDVRYELVRRYTTMLDQTNRDFRRSRTISSNTQQFSLQNTDDGLENLKLYGILEDDMKIKANEHSRLSIF